MRSFLFVVCLVLVASCSKHKRLTKSVEGRWLLTEILDNDGSHLYPNVIHEFAKAESGDDGYAAWTQYTSDFSDTITGVYRISKSGVNMYFRTDSQVAEEEAVVDDFDKNTLIVRRESGVYYYTKQ